MERNVRHNISIWITLLYVVVSWPFVTPGIAADQAPVSSTISWSLLKFTSTESVMISNHLIHPVLPSSHFALNLFQHQDLFQWGDSPHQVANNGASAPVLPMNVQGWFPLGLTDWILQSKGFSRAFTSTTVWKHQFFGAQPSFWTNSYIHTWLLEKA